MNRPVATTSRVLALAVSAFLYLLSGCSTGWDPNEDRSGARGSYQATPDGYYRVKPGDSLHAIAFNFGKDWRDLAAWNSVRAPYTIYPDQELRLTAPNRETPDRTLQNSGGDNRTASAAGPATTSAAPAKGAGSKTYDAPVQTRPVETTPSPAAVSADPGKWMWPTDGRVVSTFKPNDPARKGVDIGGKEGQAVVAAASGEVVYSGSGLLGYGELVIIKHSERLLSAYAHNRTRLVKEGEQVGAGQRIAEMGSNDRNQAMLHFEIRLNGNPQDPLKYLPGR